MKTGLVLEGGAMRGIYTAGVLDAFMEQGLHFDGVIGVSAGALHGCSFVSGQKGRSIRYFKKYRNDKHFMSMWNPGPYRGSGRKTIMLPRHSGKTGPV